MGYVIILWFACGFGAALVLMKAGIDVGVWSFLAIFSGPIGLLLLLGVGTNRACPHCKLELPGDYAQCPFCHLTVRSGEDAAPSGASPFWLRKDPRKLKRTVIAWGSIGMILSAVLIISAGPASDAPTAAARPAPSEPAVPPLPQAKPSTENPAPRATRADSPSVNSEDQRMAQLAAQIRSQPPEDQALSEDASMSSAGLTELKGKLAQRREFDIWLIRNITRILNSTTRQGKALSYCATTIYGIEKLLESGPGVEYTLQPDGTVLSESAKPPKTQEQVFRDGLRAQYELENGGSPLVQDCAASVYWFGTWQNSQVPSEKKFLENITSARADIAEIDNTLDPRLVEGLPKAEPER